MAALVLVGGAILHSAFGLVRNLSRARKIGVPIRVILIDHVNPFWLVCDRAVLSLIRRLPFGLGNNSFTRYNYRGWEVPDRYYTHHELGDAYILVSPGNVWLYIADPDAITDLCKRGKEFPRDTSVTGQLLSPLSPISSKFMAHSVWTEMLDIFGPSISTVRGPDIVALGRPRAHMPASSNTDKCGW